MTSFRTPFGATLALLLAFAPASELPAQAFDCVLLNDDNTNIFVAPDDCFVRPEHATWCSCVRSVFTNPVKGQVSGFNQAITAVIEQPGIGNHRVEVLRGTLDLSSVQIGEVIGGFLIHELIPQGIPTVGGQFFTIRGESRVTAVSAASVDFDVVVNDESAAARIVLRYDPEDAAHSLGLFYRGRLTSLGPGGGFVAEYRFAKEAVRADDPATTEVNETSHAAIEVSDIADPGFSVRSIFQFFTTESGVYTLPSDDAVDVLSVLRRFQQGPSGMRDLILNPAEVFELGDPDLCEVVEDPTPCKVSEELLRLKNSANENSPPRAAITVVSAETAMLLIQPIELQIRCGSARAIFLGSNSDDGDGGTQPLAYEWSILSGPDGGATIPPKTQSFRNTEITFTLPGTYEIGLQVNDGAAVDNTDATSVELTVFNDLDVNVPPTAFVSTVPKSAKLELVQGVASITVDASGSSNGFPGEDDCMQVLSFRWRQVLGPPGHTATIVAPNEATTEVRFNFPGDYVFEVEVDDGAADDNTDRAEVQVEVSGTPLLAVFRRGDTDGNRTLELTDAIRLLNFLFLGTQGLPACPDAADSDDNGTLELTDAVRVLQVLFLGTSFIPAPGSEVCGPDPTADGLSDCQYPNC
jgi:hypothetical protein